MMVDMLCEIDPTYRNKVLYTKDGQKKYLYGKLVKAVYGTILGDILFYNKLSKQLEDWRFEKATTTNVHGIRQSMVKN